VTQPMVSVIVPVRDRRALLSATLDALAAQTFDQGYEVLVVDDGSTDGSAAEAEGRRDLPVRTVRTAGAGAVAARRLGAEAARGRYLAFTDSDCVPEPGWLVAGVAALDAGADLVQGTTVPARPPAPFEHTVEVRVPTGLYETCNVFYRREAYDAAGGFDLDAGRRWGSREGSPLRRLGLGEDSLLGWRVRRAGGRAVFAPGAVVRHHVFEADVRRALRRAWSTRLFPPLLREVPELRRTLLWRGVVLDDRPTRLALHGAAGAAAYGRRRLAAALLAVWVAGRWRRMPARRLAALPADLAVDALTAAALVVGSVRARSPVL
jgi:glycosyltransferase involved in cell wall biosynthesis